MEAEIIGCDHPQTDGPIHIKVRTDLEGQDSMPIYECVTCGVLMTSPKGQYEADDAS